MTREKCEELLEYWKNKEIKSLSDTLIMIHKTSIYEKALETGKDPDDHRIWTAHSFDIVKDLNNFMDKEIKIGDTVLFNNKKVIIDYIDEQQGLYYSGHDVFHKYELSFITTRFNIGDKVYKFGDPKDVAEITDYNADTGDYFLLTKDGGYWTVAYEWTKEATVQYSPPEFCNHLWKLYQGLNHQDYYCTECDKKRDINDPPNKLKT